MAEKQGALKLRALLQDEYRNNSSTDASSIVGLSVLIAVAVLFTLNICLCLWKIFTANSEEESGTRNRNRLRRIATRSPTVVFVNPGGSVRIGEKSKHSETNDQDNVDCTSSPGSTSAANCTFTEVVVEYSQSSGIPSRASSMELAKSGQSN